MDINITLSYNSTLEGSRADLMLTVTGENNTSTKKQILSLTCHSSGKWIADPPQFACSSITTVVPSGIVTEHNIVHTIYHIVVVVTTYYPSYFV